MKSGKKNDGRIIAKGELADGWGSRYVREITASQAENERCSGQDAKQCGQRPSVRVETRFGASSKDDLLCYYNLNVKAVIYPWASTGMNYVLAERGVTVWKP